MATRPKRKYQTTSEQNALLEEFYRELDEEDELLLGNRFVGEENDTTLITRVIITKLI